MCDQLAQLFLDSSVGTCCVHAYAEWLRDEWIPRKDAPKPASKAEKRALKQERMKSKRLEWRERSRVDALVRVGLIEHRIEAEAVTLHLLGEVHARSRLVHHQSAAARLGGDDIKV